MRTLLAYLPAIACGGMMFFCIRMMMGGRSKGEAAEGPKTASTSPELTRLREEVARLRAERSEGSEEPAAPRKD